jgi:hypothetical protein
MVNLKGAKNIQEIEYRQTMRLNEELEEEKLEDGREVSQNMD